MKVGDIVRVKTGSGYVEEDEDTTCYWPDAKGQIGMIISTGSFWLNCRPRLRPMRNCRPCLKRTKKMMTKKTMTRTFKNDRLLPS